jgi:ribose 5-phosphate isomerase A
MSSDDFKRQAAEQALGYVRGGMDLGLGTGSTAAHFVRGLGARVAQGLKVRCVATSEQTETLARSLGITMTTLDEVPFLDLTVDGADELDEGLRLIKGGGGALLREKIVASASAAMIVIADHAKLVGTLGAFPLPVEVVPFGLAATRSLLADLAEEAGCAGEITVRIGADGRPFQTDGGHLILDCAFGLIEDPEQLDAALRLVPGVVETGLFIDLAAKAIIAGPTGIREIDAPDEVA